MGAARVIAIARNPARLEKLHAIDPKRVATVALGKGESITQKVKALTDGQGASVVAHLSPGGVQTLLECIRNLEGGSRVALIGANPEPLNLPVRYLMIRSIEICMHGWRYETDVSGLPPLSPISTYTARRRELSAVDLSPDPAPRLTSKKPARLASPTQWFIWFVEYVEGVRIGLGLYSPEAVVDSADKSRDPPEGGRGDAWPTRETAPERRPP